MFYPAENTLIYLDRSLTKTRKSYQTSLKHLMLQQRWFHNEEYVKRQPTALATTRRNRYRSDCNGNQWRNLYLVVNQPLQLLRL